MRKMSKKGMIFSTLAKIIMAIAVFVLIVMIFFIGPEAFYVKLKSITPRAQNYIDSSNDPTNDDLNRKAQDQAQKAFGEFTQAFFDLRDSSANICFYQIPYATFLKLFNINYNSQGTDVNYLKHYYFTISPPLADGSQAITMLRDIPNTGGKAEADNIESEIESVKIDGASIELVYGDAAARFLAGWMTDSGATFAPQGSRGSHIMNVNTPGDTRSRSKKITSEVKFMSTFYVYGPGGDKAWNFITGHNLVDDEIDRGSIVLYKYTTDDNVKHIAMFMTTDRFKRECQLYYEPTYRLATACFGAYGDSTRTVPEYIVKYKYPHWDKGKGICIEGSKEYPNLGEKNDQNQN